jgi:integrase
MLGNPNKGARRMTRKSQAPSYDRYRGTYARVIIDRRSVHLGKYDSEESHRKYRQAIATWSADMPVEDSPSASSISVAELLAGYLEHADRYYGHDANHVGYVKRIIKVVRELFSDSPAVDFGPKKLKVVRSAFVGKGWVRSKVNEAVRNVIAMFSWAVEQELIPGSVVHTLREVRTLRRGHTEAPEGRTVHAVPQATVEITLPFLTSVLADMVQLQLVTGCRPGEICSLMPEQVDRTGDVWLYRPVQHKTEHLGHDRTIAIGPRGQRILLPYLLRPGGSPCFSPKESLVQHMDEAHENRVTPLSCGHKPRPGGRKRRLAEVGDSYTVASYRRAIERACARAGVEVWTPHRLRHTAGETVRASYGLDGCQAILGHRNARVSEIYSELSTAKAVEIARKLG